MSEMRLYLLGNPRLECDGSIIPLQTKGEQRWIALLAYLAVERRVVNRALLAQLIWEYEENPRDRLRRHTLEELKKRIGTEWLSITSSGVQLATGRLWVDVNAFLDLLDQVAGYATTSLSHGISLLEQSLALYSGDFLGSYTFPEIGQFSEWHEQKADLLRQKFSEAAEKLIVALSQRGDVPKAERYAALWTKHKRTEVKAHAWLLHLYERQGKSRALMQHMRSATAALAAHGVTRADLQRARERIMKQTPDATSHSVVFEPSSAIREIALPNEETGNPAFYQNYLDILYDLATRSPLEAVRFAENISSLLFDLMDRPSEVNRILDQIENQLLHTSSEDRRKIEFYLQLQRLRIYRALGMPDKAVNLINQIPDDDERLLTADRETRGAWYHNRGLIRCWIESSYQNALDDFNKARTESVLLGNMGWEAGIIADMGLVYWNQGNLRAAEEHLMFTRERLLQMSGHDRQVVMCIGNLALVWLFQGRVEEALASVSHQLNLSTDLRYAREMRRATGNRGIIRFHLGRYAEAISDLEADLAAARNQNEGFLHAQVNLSRCYRAGSRIEAGRTLVTEALRVAEAKQYASVQILARRILAEYLPDVEAVPLLQDALEAARQRGRRFDEAACLLSLAHRTKSTGLHRKLQAQGVSLLRELGAERWLKRNPLELPTV